MAALQQAIEKGLKGQADEMAPFHAFIDASISDMKSTLPQEIAKEVLRSRESKKFVVKKRYLMTSFERGSKAANIEPAIAIAKEMGKLTIPSEFKGEGTGDYFSARYDSDYESDAIGHRGSVLIEYRFSIPETK